MGSLLKFFRPLPRKQRNRIRGLVERIRNRWINHFRSYGSRDLVKSLRALGLRDGDTVMLHSSFKTSSGFQGSPSDVAEAFLEVIGETGNLMMVSLPTTGASYEYLRRLRVFDVRKTPSRMGLVSEFFRRREGVLRSLHPSHPMLAYGPKAGWIVEGHDKSLFPCGPGSPFDKAVELDGKVAFFDTGLDKMTFFHWLEHRIRDRIAVPLYLEEPFEVPVLDQDGELRTVRTYAFSPEIIIRRRDRVLHRQMWKAGIVKGRQVGNTRILCVNLREVIDCVDRMAEEGIYFYDLA